MFQGVFGRFELLIIGRIYRLRFPGIAARVIKPPQDLAPSGFPYLVESLFLRSRWYVNERGEPQFDAPLLLVNPDNVRLSLQSLSWMAIAAVPALFLAHLFLLTFFSAPEYDDFCLAYQNFSVGLIDTVWISYHNLVGRIVPLILIQLPAIIAKVTGVDYFICYVAILLGSELLLASSLIILSKRLWPTASTSQAACFGLAMVATICALAPSLRELMYWLPGVACYVVPSIIFAFVFTELIDCLNRRRNLSAFSTLSCAIGALVASLCNEFTAPWLVGLAILSFAARKALKHRLQIGAHLAIGGAALFAFAILTLAPATHVRMGLFPEGGHFYASVYLAFIYSVSDLVRFLGHPIVWCWLLFVFAFSLRADRISSELPRQMRLLAVAIVAFSLACGYLAYFVHQYATGLKIVPRAQNQTMIMLLLGLTIGTQIFARSVRPVLLKYDNIATKCISAPALFVLMLPLFFGGTSVNLRAEEATFHAYWLESIRRHATLSLSSNPDPIVPLHRYKPKTLMSSDVSGKPSVSPNDCMARFYHKNTIIAGAPSTSINR